MNNAKIDEFFKRHNFSVVVDTESILAEFDRQMDLGLSSSGGSSLAMLPAYTDIGRPVPVAAPTIVLDAGGTNLRVAVVWFDAKGVPRIEDFHKYPMPGTEGIELSSAEFFDTLSNVLMPFAERAETIGFCFSYPAEITPDHDGRLIRWTKQVMAPEVVNQTIGARLLASLHEKTGLTHSISIINDTVATLLAGRSAGLARQYSSFVGFILGTGTNTAFIEKNSRICKVEGLDPAASMAVNVESGNFDGIFRSDFDKEMDSVLLDRGSSLFEKMISGAYLGKVGLAVIKQAAKEGLFSENASIAIAKLGDVPNKDFDDFTANPFVTGTALDAVPMSDEDRRTFIALGTPVFIRAARLAAANIAAAVIRCGEGHDPLHPVCVTIDGSTFYKTRSASFKSRIEGCLRDILDPRGIFFDIIKVDEAPIVGAAVAGLTI